MAGANEAERIGGAADCARDCRETRIQKARASREGSEREWRASVATLRISEQATRNHRRRIVRVTLEQYETLTRVARAT